MRRFFILDKFNTWYDWRLLLTAKSTPRPEPKTNYVKLDGASGTLDLTEALTGEVAYDDRKVTASFSASEGDYNSREYLYRDIVTALHGRRIRLVEPDDTEHYFLGRVKVKNWKNTPAYATFDIEATCEPWRYAVSESERVVDVSGRADVVIMNAGDKTLMPEVTVSNQMTIRCNGSTVELTPGTYLITDLRLVHGANVVSVSGYGRATFAYREASL